MTDAFQALRLSCAHSFHDQYQAQLALRQHRTSQSDDLEMGSVRSEQMRSSHQRLYAQRLARGQRKLFRQQLGQMFLIQHL